MNGYLKECAKQIQNLVQRCHFNLRSDCHVGKRCKVRYARLDSNVSVGDDCNVTHSQLGKCTYVGNDTCLSFSKIGAFCSIASQVTLAVGLHPAEYVSTSPATYSTNFRFPVGYLRESLPVTEYAYTDETRKFYCEIGNDVWIATRATLVCIRR